MTERLVAAALVVALLLLGTASVPIGATDLSATCPPRGDAASSTILPAVPAELPAGIEVTALAACPALELPEGTEFNLAIERVTLNADVESKTRRTAGPVLYWVEVGTVDVFRNGRNQTLVPGESLLVERNTLVKLRNESGESAQVLLVGLLPPKGQLPITAASDAPYTWNPLPEEHELIAHEELLVSGAGIVAREETLLFAACLNWTDAAAEMAERSYPGPVGVWVLRGQAVVNGSEQLSEGGNVLTGAYSPLRVQAGEQVPAVLMFGALAASGLSAAPPDSAAVTQAAGPPLGCAGSAQVGEVA
jgi:hypothetical protein